MQRQRTRDTETELMLRRVLHRRGLRYRLHRRPLPHYRRLADLIFPSTKIAVFVDGCFWHGCPDHGTWPRANADFWRAKIENNRRRDVETIEYLVAAGWLPIRVWEHEDVEAAADRVEEAVRARQADQDAS
jgi:DNA mismatch endonuclease (patch repair protein)